MKTSTGHTRPLGRSSEVSGRVDFLGCVSQDLELLVLPLYLHRIPAGFPSPADDYIESGLDLNDLLIRNPAATFMVRVSGDSMIGVGIHDGDILVIDRSETAVHGKIVVAALDGEMTVKRLHLKDGQCRLVPENKAFQPIQVGTEQDLQVWGVVVGVVRRV
ncbi:MAG: translesion error-prone DNA polymerase V autoproteolytic subunit [Desulfomicrobium apsheronum]|nr:translesion error-prone DNA polymerase V autoproteolytic subunit [Desulfomicrobium apsheronum]